MRQKQKQQLEYYLAVKHQHLDALELHRQDLRPMLHRQRRYPLHFDLHHLEGHRYCLAKLSLHHYYLLRSGLHRLECPPKQRSPPREPRKLLNLEPHRMRQKQKRQLQYRLAIKHQRLGALGLHRRDLRPTLHQLNRYQLHFGLRLPEWSHHRSSHTPQ